MEGRPGPRIPVADPLGCAPAEAEVHGAARGRPRPLKRWGKDLLITGPKGQPFPAAPRCPRPLVPPPPFSRPGFPVHPRRMKADTERVGQSRAERSVPSELSRSGGLPRLGTRQQRWQRCRSSSLRPGAPRSNYLYDPDHPPAPPHPAQRLSRTEATAEAACQKSLSCQTLGEMDKDVTRSKRDSDTVCRGWHCVSDLAGSESPVGRRLRPVWGLSPLGCKQTGFQEWEACPGLPPHSPPQTSSSCPLSGCFSPPWFPPSHTSVTDSSPGVGFSVDLLLCTCVCVCVFQGDHT